VRWFSQNVKVSRERKYVKRFDRRERVRSGLSNEEIRKSNKRKDLETAIGQGRWKRKKAWVTAF
jgi:hypothetical protein